MTRSASAIDVQVHADHEVSETDRAYERRKVAQAAQRAGGAVLFARIDLRREPNRPRPAKASGVVDVNGTPKRAHVSAATLLEAIDLLEDRLAHRLEHSSFNRANRR